MEDEAYPQHCEQDENIIMLAIINQRTLKHGKTGIVYLNITGEFPYPSNRGYQYIMVLYNWESNAILGQPKKNRSKENIIRAIQQLYKHLKS
eukprot:4877235-Ditylum_brightwellii.AAC.1